MLSGSAADVMLEAASARHTKKVKTAEPQPTGYICVPKEILRQFFGKGKCKGLVTAVTQETKRPKQVVTGVLHGDMGSQSIAEALVRGISDRLGNDAAGSITIGQPREATCGLSPEELKEFNRGGRYHGLMGKVAKQCGTRVGTVSSVAHGKIQSRRIIAALRAGMNTFTAGPTAGQRPKATKSVHFSEDVILQFTTGKYRGTVVRVARDLCVGRCRVSEVLHGRGQSARIIAALKSEIARIDAEHAAKNGAAQ
jgi:hypothetical protein